MGANVTPEPEVASLPSDELTEARRRYQRASSPDEKMVLAREVHRLAKRHKRSAEYHKRAQRRAMETFDQFRSDLEAMGVRVVTEPHMPRGGNSD